MMLDSELDAMPESSDPEWASVFAQAREANALRAEVERLRSQRVYLFNDEHAMAVAGTAGKVFIDEKEIATLRARVADLELLWKTLYFRMDRDLMFNEREKTWDCFDRASDSPTAVKLFTVPDDGTGLPLLTDEARAALRGEGV